MGKAYQLEMKYYIIAGEASGDLHGANLIKALKQEDPEARFRVWGGDRMQEAGADLVKHYKHHSFMGFSAVLKNLGAIRSNFRLCRQDIARYQPDVVIFIDYSGFNLRMAAQTHKMGFRNFYYIAPQVWVWRSNRIKKIRKYIEKTFVILPFEPEFYQKHHHTVVYEGHPVLDALPRQQLLSRQQLQERFGLADLPLVVLMPGSRRQEIDSMLPAMAEAASRFKNLQFVVAAAPALDKELYQQHLNGASIPLVFDQTYALLQHARAAVVTSGTASLETALLRVPQMVCYKTGTVTYKILKRLLKIEYISIANLILKKMVFREFIQHEMNADNMATELEKLLNDGHYRQRMLQDYDRLEQMLGGPGTSGRVAKAMYAHLVVEKVGNSTM